MANKWATKSTGTARFFDYSAKVDAPYEMGAPIPAPEVIDDNSEASWALWAEATRSPGSWELDTQPMELSET